jgi:hypothetical protein
MTFQLLTTGNQKTLKGEKKGYITYILHLAPADVAGVGNMCPKATPGCKWACLNLSGHGGMINKDTGTNAVQEARKRKTRWFAQDKAGFIAQLKLDIAKAVKQAERKGMIPVFRLNGTSDLSWEKYDVIQSFPNVQFYDYTKIPNRKVGHLPNYHLTFSQADGNDADVAKAMANDMNVAVVFRKTLPQEYKGRIVVDGDDSDLRFLDAENVIVGLKAKGKARKDTSGFVVDIA